MSNKCQYCDKDFSSKSCLIKHQKTAKYCIKLQSSITNPGIQNVNYPCEYCKKEFTTPHNLNYHNNRCIDKYKFIISQKDEELRQQDEKYKEELLHKDKELYYKNEELFKKDNELRKKDEYYKDELLKQEKKIIEVEAKLQIIKEQGERATATVEEIAKQPKQVNTTTTTTNQNKILIQTPLDMSKEKFESIISSCYDSNYLIGGQKGAANFVSEKILRDEKGQLMYICSDPSRQIFQYKNERGDIEKDVKAMKLTKSLFDAGLKQKTHALASEKILDGDSDAFMTYTECWQGIREMEDDNSAFRTQLSALTTK